MVTSKRRSSGFTLISMLVGLVIGLIGIAAMLALYRTLINTSSQITQQAAKDEQIATSSLISKQQLQQAGFGITNATPGTDLVVLTGATLVNGQLSGTVVASYGATVTGNAVVWDYNPTVVSATTNPAGILCEGLIVTTIANNATNNITTILQWLSPVSCANAAQWQALSWQSNQLAAIKNLGGTPSFQISPATCWPYGQTTAISSLQVNYYQFLQAAGTAAPVSASTASSAQFDAIPFFSLCLPNFNL
jgi:Tfp pilus assembly protein PilW